MTAILGISDFYHDSAAALVVDGTVVAAAQEERFSRKKHDAGFPRQAIRFCLEQSELTPADLDYVGFYDKPFLKFGRLLETYVAYGPQGYESFRMAMPSWLQQKLRLPREMWQALGSGYRKAFTFTEHHESHAASAFFPSPFEEGAILTLDGVGEWATASHGVGRGNRISLTHEIHFPHSLGLLYSAFTYYCGFTVNSGEYKLMGLAPYGEPRFVDAILTHLIDLRPDGSFRLDLDYFNYCAGLTMTSRRFHDLFGGPPRNPDEPISERHMDLAASIQKVTEDVMLRAARHAHRETGLTNLCLAGGVALNCVGNGRILREGPFEHVWIQPAAGDAGGALGVALFIWHQLLNQPRTPCRSDSQQGSLLGPSFGDAEVRGFLDGVGARYRWVADEQELCDLVATHIAGGRVVGWFQGAMEYGPRALGSRSILGDARSPEMQSVMNLKVKFRESFRPFAPAVLRERAHEFFVVRPDTDSPYMLTVAPVQESRRLTPTAAHERLTGIDLLQVPRSQIPAVTHVDYTARVQTVDAERHGRFRKLMDRFERLTGCPVLINTNFNLGWDPIVNRPEEAFSTFMSSEMDMLAMGHAVLEKTQQPAVSRARRVGGDGRESDPGLEEVLSCPACGGGLTRDGGGAVCAGCGQQFAQHDGIWQMFWPHERVDGDVTDIVKQFYEAHPFPNYDDHDSLESLLKKSRRGIYARLLAEQILFNSRVLEVGCGTGQLTNFLVIGCRTLVGTDLCLNSLRLAEGFRRTHGLHRARFVQMNLFRPSVRDEQFDVVLCNGVLHHTSDPYRGFRQIGQLVRPGGYLVVGLYNRYGRWLLDARRAVFTATGGRMKWLDPYLRRSRLSEAKRDAWFADQYQHPHESKHTVGEVQRWLDLTGFEFVNSIPKPRVFDSLDENERLFEPSARATSLDRALAQAQMVFTGSQEGGFFIMIARKLEAGRATRCG